MDKLSNLALLSQMLESAEKNIQSAKQILREIMGSKSSVSSIAEKARIMMPPSMGGGGKVIEGVFDGQNMMGPDGKKYPVPANYASKSKLVEGDVLKLTISDDGSFIYKQIGPVEREKKLGILSQTENGEYRVTVDGKSYRLLLASLTYFKAEPGDEVAIVVPQSGDAQWAAVENVIKSDGTQGPGAIADAPKERMEDIDRDLELGEQE
ncbi:MAG: hypothetical protein A2751_04465 [Candidatus Doudnabacteria bacterium RIFCSPHIGHO2_01_FULL_46_14]|uniref:50S ribosomal protein L7/L12 n=1 Tax=Candidatus Doudnabacteria bacterium RIFCSPHIGHO2_01_FULL_46_14 TaxID=1817824 RepID=A0A1F5NNK8_9BACT|nr:MAG: hypothetical protein A2751_04465 [Candidatus Doudnabacteria bacterium RIFCSPHIGHO2_01_FULL_46_14]